MKYVLIPDTSAAANYTQADGGKVRVVSTISQAEVASPHPVVTSLAGLTPIPYTADQAAKFAAAKSAKLARMEGDYAASLAGGVTVGGIGGITLAATAADQNTFSRLMTLLATAEAAIADPAARAAFAAAPQTIADAAGAPHTLTVAQLRTLIVAYGQQVSARWSAMSTKRAAAIAATTFEQLESV